MKDLIPPFVKDEPHISGRFFIDQKGHWYFAIDENTVKTGKLQHPIEGSPIFLPFNGGEYGVMDQVVNGQFMLKMDDSDVPIYRLMCVHNASILVPFKASLEEIKQRDEHGTTRTS